MTPVAEGSTAARADRRRIVTVVLPVHLQRESVSPVAATCFARADPRGLAPACRVYRGLLGGCLIQPPGWGLDASTSQINAISSAAEAATNGRSAV